MFFRRQEKSRGLDWLLVGLGNPGEQYEFTRHNVGFRVIDELAERAGVPVRRLKHRAYVNTVSIGGQRVMLMKPVTYMNCSGEAVSDAASFLKITPDHILIICDDVSLPPGKLRIRREGSAGGHNGLKSIILHLHTETFPRLKIGVGGKPYPEFDMADWVLSRFSGPDKDTIDAAVKRAADAVEYMMAQNLDKAMSRFNNGSQS